MGQTLIFILLILDATNLVFFLEISLYSEISDSPKFSYISDYLFWVSFAGSISSTWLSNVNVPMHSTMTIANNTGLNTGNLLRVDFRCSYYTTHKSGNYVRRYVN